MAADNQMGNTKRKLGWKERRAQALSLRRSGLPYKEIGRTLGISESRAHAIIKSELQALAEQTSADATILRELELTRLDRLIYRLFQKIEGGHDSELEAARVLLKAMQQRQDLLGLRKPTEADKPALPVDDKTLAILIADPARLAALQRVMGLDPDEFTPHLPGVTNGNGG